MSNPDFSQSPKHVALAEAMVNAVRSSRGLKPCKLGELPAMDREYMLIEATAAITHLGSGYVLPEATEENAERLAKACYGSHYSNIEQHESHKVAATNGALKWLRALHAAFCDAEKQCKNTLNPGDPSTCLYGESECPCYYDPNSPADPTYCRKGCLKPFGHPGQHSDEDAQTYGEEPKRDTYADGQRRRERQRLVWEFFRDSTTLTARPWHEDVQYAVDAADAYLAWRDADEAAAKERVCRK